ncbi:MAG: DJ-1/PfpI family protein [Anaerolineae bacterium]
MIEVHAADTPDPNFAFFIFDPQFNDFDYVYGKFYAWVHSDDWSEYFSDGEQRGAFSTELDGACARVFGTIERRFGSRIRIAVTERAQIEIIDCTSCQHPQACAPPLTPTPPERNRGTLLVVIAPGEFNDDEYTETRALLEARGYAVRVASHDTEVATGAYGLIEVRPDLSLSTVEAGDYGAVIFIGGEGAKDYWDDPRAHRVAQAAATEDKVVAAISLAPVILARAGVLEGKQATVYDPATYCIELEAGGAVCTGQRVQRDGCVVTARLEQATDLFAEAILEALQRCQ